MLRPFFKKFGFTDLMLKVTTTKRMKKIMKRNLKKIFPASVVNLAKMLLSYLRPKVKNYSAYIKATKKLVGIEIGGPSAIFNYDLPVYKSCLNLTFVNFNNNTIWEGELSDTVNYYRKKVGKQYISEATDLQIFSDKKFDFLLSSNCLEHVANPIKAMSEWKRITSGKMILILPHKDFNFDHKRSITSFEHLVNDFNNDVDESDLTHLDEILHFHDLKKDPPAGSFEQFYQRSLDNINNRCLHHHVFDNELVFKICDYLGMTIIEQTVDKKNWIFLINTNHSLQKEQIFNNTPNDSREEFKV